MLLAEGAAGRQDAFGALAAAARRADRPAEEVARAPLDFVTTRSGASAAT